MSKAGFKRMLRQRSAVATRQPGELETAGKAGPAPYSPPTDEQLAHFVAAMVNAEAERMGIATLSWSPLMAGLMLEANPAAKAGWIRRHREFQEAVENEVRSHRIRVE